jgi:hypothetical protein
MSTTCILIRNGDSEGGDRRDTVLSIPRCQVNRLEQGSHSRHLPPHARARTNLERSPLLSAAERDARPPQETLRSSLPPDLPLGDLFQPESGPCSAFSLRERPMLALFSLRGAPTWGGCS